MKRLLLVVMMLMMSQSISADFTIHVLSPWREDDSQATRDTMLMLGNPEVGYYPGSGMMREGGGWFYYTYDSLGKTGGQTFNVVSLHFTQFNTDHITYSYKFSIDSLFSPLPASTDEIWIVITDTTKAPKVYDLPPVSKVINIFNPWTENSPKMILSNRAPMRMHAREDICGWYRYYYAGPVDSLGQVVFTDYYRTEKYTSTGLSNGAPIDLRTAFATGDTVYILPKPFPYGPPSITPSFPGRTGECGFRKISGVFRDWALDNTSFFNSPTGKSGGGSVGMVQPTLQAPDYKPRKTTDTKVNTRDADSLETWYKTKTFADGTDNDTCIDLTMKKADDGRWEFDSDWMGGFFPLDNFNDSNNFKYADAGKKMHNFHFTMEMHLQFIYMEGAGLEFYFRGDDDVWIYVNNHLAIDLGGLHEKAKDTLYLDKSKTDLGLVNGQTYNMDIFFAERNPVASNFLIKTSMDLRNSDDLYYLEFPDPKVKGKSKYEVWQRKQTNGYDCGTTQILNESEPSSVYFYMAGPQFQDSIPLPQGVYYGGITIDTTNHYTFAIDSAAITGLMPGVYRITFVNTANQERTGYYEFTVPPKPDHLDIMLDTMTIDPKTDAVLDSIFMGVETDSILLHAVIRDVYGNYFGDADNPVWASMNESVVTVKNSSTNKSKGMVVKIEGGITWVIVTQAGLKPDSVKIRTAAKPKWPIISSAVMLDNNGDIIPDLLYLALSDTFKAGQVLTSVDFDYRGTHYSIPGSSCSINQKTITAPFVSGTGVDAKPSGTTTMILSVDGKPQSHSKEFTDGVGPALIAADVLENDGNDLDVLFLTFSEPAYPATIRGNQLLLIKAGTMDTITLSVGQVTNIINDSTFSVALVSSSARPLAGDQLRLMPGSRSGTISDMSSNLPHDQNIPVTLGFRKGAASIKSAYYQDTDADGILDRIMVDFKRAVDVSEFSQVLVQWQAKGYTIPLTGISKAGDSAIVVPIRGSVVKTDKIATSGTMYISLQYKAVQDVSRSATVADSAAPVLVSATLFPGEYDVNGLRTPDTLKTAFSEAVGTPDSHPFLLSNRSGRQYSFEVTILSGKDSNYTFTITKMNPDDVSPVKGDSIWINPQSGMHDMPGSVQANLLNHRVLLNIIQIPPEWIISVGPNPMRTHLGTTIIVQPRKMTDLTPYNANAVIYDPVGNKVLVVPMFSNGRKFSYKWNGCNSNGRLVGSGTYLAIVSTYEGSKKLWSGHCLIGLNR